jgi:hypothetical protein
LLSDTCCNDPAPLVCTYKRSELFRMLQLKNKLTEVSVAGGLEAASLAAEIVGVTTVEAVVTDWMVPASLVYVDGLLPSTLTSKACKWGLPYCGLPETVIFDQIFVTTRRTRRTCPPGRERRKVPWWW